MLPYAGYPECDAEQQVLRTYLYAQSAAAVPAGNNPRVCRKGGADATWGPWHEADFTRLQEQIIDGDSRYVLLSRRNTPLRDNAISGPGSLKMPSMRLS